MKRVPDVLSSPDLTKKVLREVCILRRLNHPFIISLRDAFLRPSASGTPLRACQLTISAFSYFSRSGGRHGLG